MQAFPDENAVLIASALNPQWYREDSDAPQEVIDEQVELTDDAIVTCWNHAYGDRSVISEQTDTDPLYN